MPGPYYVRSGATGTGTGADWPNAYTNLDAASAVVAAGETIYVAHDHNYTGYAGNVSLDFPVSTGAPVNVVCVNDATASSSYANANTPAASTIVTTPTAIEYPSGGAYTYAITGHVSVQGMYFKCTVSMTILGGAGDEVQTYRYCKFELISTSARVLNIGSDTANKSSSLYFYNVDIVLANNTGTYVFGSACTTMLWRGGALLNTTATPSNAWRTFSRASSRMLFEGVDFSAIAATLLAATASTSVLFDFRRCKKHASYALSALTAGNDNGTRVESYALGSSGTTSEQALWIDSSMATAASTTSIYRNTGATDGTDSWSVAVQAKASSGIAHGKDFRIKLADLWWDSSKSKIRVYVGQKNGQTRLTDAKAWIEATWVRDGDPLSGHGTSHANDYGPLTTGASWTTDSGSTWTDGAATVDVLSYAEITPTDDVSGPMQVWFVLAADNSAADAEYYVDPEVELVA